MKIIRSRKAFIKWRSGLDAKNRLGFVPTMGALHEGHLSLVQRAKRECQVVVASIFVNPTQFGPKEDFKNYPRQEKKDFQMLMNAGVDVVFAPSSAKEIYPSKDETSLRAKPSLCRMMEAKQRPQHFDGVVTVVAKLFSIVKPHQAFFGEKDYQQLQIIKAMVADLFLPIEIRAVPTRRESSGLALSSRNQYFTNEERQLASYLFQCLRDSKSIADAKNKLSKRGFKIEYLESWNEDLSKKTAEESGRWLVAARFKGVRLIDNLKRKGRAR